MADDGSLISEICRDCLGILGQSFLTSVPAKNVYETIIDPNPVGKWTYGLLFFLFNCLIRFRTIPMEHRTNCRIKIAKSTTPIEPEYFAIADIKLARNQCPSQGEEKLVIVCMRLANPGLKQLDSHWVQ